MTLNELIYNVRNLIKDKSDDQNITDRQLEFMINNIRAELIRQDINKGKTISDTIKQDLGIVDMIVVDRSESPTITSNTYITRSKNIIPSFVEANQKDLVTYVGGIDKVTPFQISSKPSAGWSRYSRYASMNTHAFFKSGYLYLFGPNYVTEHVSVEGVFENPREVFELIDPEWDEDTEGYPMSRWMVRTMNELIKKSELSHFFTLKEDFINDGSNQIKK